MFKQTVKVKTTSLLAVLLLVGPLLSIIIWFTAQYASEGIYSETLLMAQYIEMAIFRLLALLAVVLSAFSVMKDRKHRNDGRNMKESYLILLLSILIAFAFIVAFV